MTLTISFQALTEVEKGRKELDTYLNELKKFFGEDDHEVDKAIEQLNYYLNKKI